LKITCKETVTRFKTIDVPDREITDEDDLECNSIREAMWDATDKDGWDHEYVQEVTFSEGGHESTILYKD